MSRLDTPFSRALIHQSIRQYRDSLLGASWIPVMVVFSFAPSHHHVNLCSLSPSFFLILHHPSQRNILFTFQHFPFSPRIPCSSCSKTRLQLAVTGTGSPPPPPPPPSYRSLSTISVSPFNQTNAYSEWIHETPIAHPIKPDRPPSNPPQGPSGEASR